MINPVEEKFRHAHELHLHGQLANAMLVYQEVVALDPRHADAWHRMGCIYSDSNVFEPALNCFSNAIRLHGSNAGYHNNLGECYRKMGQLDQGLVCYQQAVKIAPRYLVAHVNLSSTLHALGRTGEAKRVADEALQLEPTSVEAHCIRATLLLARGEFAKGWAEHEWRWSLVSGEPPWLDATRWQGGPLEGRSVLIQAEQGLGDTLQFARYIPWVVEQGGRPTLSVQDCLVPLLRDAALCDVVSRGQPLPECDLKSSPMSLPWALRDQVTGVASNVPYLRARDQLVEHWRQRLAGVSGFRVGINWQGNPQFRFDQLRSVPLNQFAPLAQLPGVQLISLQKQQGVEQLAALNGQFAVHDLGAEFYAEQAAFVDTVAVMKNLDLVITSDTAMAHVAGALGVPVWVLLSTMPDWRWMYERGDSLWYPTMRLFRQRSPGDWREVFARVAEELSIASRRQLL